MQGRVGFPAGELGYTRGSDFLYGGSGSGMGNGAQGTAALGSGIGPLGAVGGWEPSVVYLVGLVLAEMVFFHILSRMLK